MAAWLLWTTNSSSSAMKDAADLKVFILRTGRKIYNFLLHKCLINTWNCFPIFGKSFALRVLGTEAFDLAFIFLFPLINENILDKTSSARLTSGKLAPTINSKICHLPFYSCAECSAGIVFTLQWCQEKIIV